VDAGAGACVGVGAYLMYIGGAGSAIIVADDATIIGVVDDPFLVLTGGIFVIGGGMAYFGY
jgi:hypothetical protein